MKNVIVWCVCKTNINKPFIFYALPDLRLNFIGDDPNSTIRYWTFQAKPVEPNEWFMIFIISSAWKVNSIFKRLTVWEFEMSVRLSIWSQCKTIDLNNVESSLRFTPRMFQLIFFYSPKPISILRIETVLWLWFETVKWHGLMLIKHCLHCTFFNKVTLLLYLVE